VWQRGRVGDFFGRRARVLEESSGCWRYIAARGFSKGGKAEERTRWIRANERPKISYDVSQRCTLYKNNRSSIYTAIKV
jgi:hypothetical protein